MAAERMNWLHFGAAFSGQTAACGFQPGRQRNVRTRQFEYTKESFSFSQVEAYSAAFIPSSKQIVAVPFSRFQRASQQLISVSQLRTPEGLDNFCTYGRLHFDVSATCWYEMTHHCLRSVHAQWFLHVQLIQIMLQQEWE